MEIIENAILKYTIITETFGVIYGDKRRASKTHRKKY